MRGKREKDEVSTPQRHVHGQRDAVKREIEGTAEER